MFNNQQILRLNSAGHPIGWVNYEIAARLYYTDQIIYECGTTNLRLRGGYNRITQLRSYLNINSIILLPRISINSIIPLLRPH